MRFIIYGAGAVGGVIGGRLAQHGYDVVLIARGAHREAIAANGLTVLSPDGEAHISVPVAGHPSEIVFQPGDAVLLCMKTNDTLAALDALVATAPVETAIVCVQNGVENERLAARRFPNVYAVPVRLPSTHLEPGIVQANGTPRSGVLDIGRYPLGTDSVCEEISAALAASNFSSFPEPHAMRHKYTKLLMNLGNAIDAICGPVPRPAGLHERAKEEAVACYTAAGIQFVSDEIDLARRGEHYRVRPIAGRQRSGGSTYQSLVRGKREVEVDYLNGEIVLLGRVHGVPTPVNLVLQAVSNRMAREGLAPGALSGDELLAMIRS
ncbi:MAG: 2-dehydropantoate 2-reductase N-terminal domain-containing protein [Dehalococcoidia bacterium]|nr:ketopantoate reductase family protein [Dehalococcoidia bacterium]MCB9485177.1 ketopantoate reductase family protein [Thermoflexaceae bacterium]